MFRTLTITAITTVAFALPALAESSQVDAHTTALRHGDSGLSDIAIKTSDRTPGDRTPQRTPGATIYGAPGTEVARTPDGTSDRTPSNHYHSATQKKRPQWFSDAV